jgi:pimeloyl-ACP methyl ester carboxylesterase
MTKVQEHREATLKATWRNAPTQTINAGGVQFAYRQLGPSTGVPVVFLTHLAAVLDNWDPRVVDGIAAKHRVITFDNRGVGASSGSTPKTIEEMASDAVTFIRALGFDQVDLFGFSMGGMIAQVIAQQEPQLVRRMILAGTGPAGGEGIDKVTRISYLDTARGLLTRRSPSSSCSSPGRPTGAAPASSSWHAWRNVPTTATRPSPSAHSAPSSRPSTDGVSSSPRTSRASTSRCSS